MPAPKNRIYLRGKTYWYQRHIPERLRHILRDKYGKGQHIKRSLKTRDYDEAVIKAKGLDLKVEMDFKAAQRQLQPTVIDTITDTQQFMGDVERHIMAKIVNDLMGDTFSGPKVGTNTPPEELLAEAFENVRLEGRPVQPTENYINHLKPKLIKELFRQYGSMMKFATDPVRAHNLEEAAENMIRREAETPLEQGVSVNEAIKRFYGSYEERYYASAMHLLQRTFGTRGIKGINRSDIREVEKILYGLPRNWSKSKEFRGKSPKYIAFHVEEHNKTEGKIPYVMLKHDSIQKYIGKWVTFFNFCVAEQLMEHNPSLLIKKKTEGSSKTNFDKEALFTFFNNYNPFKENGWGWLPLLSLYHGARGNEVAGLRIRDVFQDEDGVWVIDLKQTKTDTPDKKGRRFPVHPALIQWGFCEWVEERRDHPDDMLFVGAYKTATNNYYEGNIQAKMEEWLIEADIKDEDHTYHSFRHTYTYHARRNREIREVDWKTIAGWSIGKDASVDYGDAIPPIDLLKSLKHLKFGIEGLINPNRNTTED